MSPKVIPLLRRAEPSIQLILGEFLEEQRARLAPRTLARYEDVLDLFRSYLNRDGHTIQVPEPATERVRSGWSISCALGRVGRSWHLLDVANVYPE